MPLDFSKVSKAKKLASLTSPRDIFTALRKAQGFGYLRDVQGQVLDTWDKRRTESDLVLKMNTGGGKTIVGLLILQSCLNESLGPALYVAPNTYLAVQIMNQADKLGIATVDDPEAIKYHSGEAICVVNIHKLVNGRSVFGGPGGRTSPVPIGSVVIDDVHAAIATVEEQSTLKVPETLGAYSKLWDRFSDDLRSQSEAAYLDIEASVPSAVLRVPLWAWHDQSAQVARILHEHREEGDLVFTLPLVSDLLSMCQAVFTSSALEIRPPMPPIDRITSLAEAKRRVYMTATLADDSVLVTHFDAAPQAVDQPITPVNAADIGDRMIVAPQEINPAINDEEIRSALRDFADEMNVVVLVPSRRRAEMWSDVADETAAADDIADVVEKLQAGHVGLAVLIDKYDGIDLPDDACRILVIDGLPQFYGALERREATLLGETDAMVSRQLQRVEQGMGRGVRSADDYCVVILLGSKLSQLIANPANAQKLGPATRAQLELSRHIAKELEGRDLTAILSVARQALDLDADWIAASRSALAGVTFESAGVKEVARLRREAFDAAASHQYQTASESISAAINATNEPRIKGWLQEQLAVYLQHIDAARAQQVLAAALKNNPRITRPMEGVTYRRLSASTNQARASSDYLSNQFVDGTELIVGVNTLLDDLAFDPEHTDEFEEAMQNLGSLLGFGAHRPERDTGSGPDVLWAIGNLKYLVIECKSGSTQDKIWKRDAAQLAHSMNWFTEKYDSSCSATPVLIHPVRDLEKNASPPPGTRVITTNRLGGLRKAVRELAIALSTSAAWKDPSQVANQLKQHLLAGGDIAAKYSVSARGTK